MRFLSTQLMLSVAVGGLLACTGPSKDTTDTDTDSDTDTDNTVGKTKVGTLFNVLD
jgi:hypothetical protein